MKPERNRKHYRKCSNNFAADFRIFSIFGFVESKTRNRLGVDKASKLGIIFKALNN